MKELICIVCPRGCHLTVDEENGYKVTGNTCKRGEEYGKAEVTNPVRTVTSTVRVIRPAACSAGTSAAPASAKDLTTSTEDTRCPVKTSRSIPRALIFDAMKEIEAASVAAPVKIGDVVIKGICGTDADLVACKNIA